MMRTKMKMVLSTLLCLFFSVGLFAQDKDADVSDILGKWSYSAPDAPHGYQDGTMEFKQDKGGLMAKINIQGNIIEMKEMKVEGNTYTGSFYVDGNSVSISVDRKKHTLEGKAEYGGMLIPVTCKRKK